MASDLYVLFDGEYVRAIYDNYELASKAADEHDLTIEAYDLNPNIDSIDSYKRRQTLTTAGSTISETE